MRGFYKSKIKYIKCIDCKHKVERLTPNHKRCVNCGYKIMLERARERARNLPPEKNRQNFKDWYYRNIERERKVRLARYHKTKSLTESKRV